MHRRIQHPRPFDELLTPLEEVGRAAADVRPLAALLDVLERVVEAAAAGDQPSHAAAAAQAATRALAAARRTDPDPLLEALEETVTRTVLAARSAAAEAGIPRVSGHVSPTPERLSTS